MAYPKTCHDAECRLATGHSYEGTAPPICAGEKQKEYLNQPLLTNFELMNIFSTLRCLRRSGRERRPTSKFRHSSRKNINLQFLQTQAQEADYHIEELLGPQNQTDLLLHIDPGSSKCLNQGETVRDGKPTAAFPVCLPRKDHFSATICMPVDWNGQWECREIQIDEDAGNCNNRNHKGISDLKFCLLDDLCDGGGLLQPNIPVWSLCENLDQQCSFYSKVQMSVEKLFALYLFHLIKYARDCVESCATRQKVEIPSIDLCRITLAVPIMKSEKEERLRCALSEASDRIGIDNRCVRLAHEPKSACYAVVRGIETGLTSNEGNDSLHLELRDSDELIVVDVGGCTTVRSPKTVFTLRTLH